LSCLVKYIREEVGAFSAIFAVMAPIFIAGAALAVDVTFWYSSKRDLQNAADAGALAGGYEFLASNSQASASDEARFAVLRNTNGVGQVTSIFPALDRIQVTVQSTASTFFVGQFLDAPPTITATAVAQFREGERQPAACLNLLAPDGTGLRIDGNSNVRMGPECGVQINSDGDQAAEINGVVGKLVSDDVCINGSITDQTARSIRSTANEENQTEASFGCPPIENPYSFLDEEIEQHEETCVERNNNLGDFRVRGSVRNYRMISNGTLIHNNVGYTVHPGAQLGLSGGVHYFCHDLVVNNATLVVRAHLVFLNGARLRVTNSFLRCFPPNIREVSPYEGLCFISHSGNNAVHEISRAEIQVHGGRGISFPGDTIRISGRSRFNLGTSVAINAKRLHISGNASVAIGSNPDAQQLPQRQVSQGGVRLIN
jgi:hypothetical protein